MAKVVFHTSVDFADLDVSDFLNATIVSSTPTEVTLVSGIYSTAVFGTGLGFKPGKGFTGVVSGFTASADGEPQFTVSKLNVDLDAVMINSTDPAALIKLFFNGKDQIIGSELSDVLMGFGSKDSLNGGAGNDILIGGAGRDNMTGGNGIDQFVYLETTDATRGAPDLITDLDAADFINLSNVNLTDSIAISSRYDTVADRTSFYIDVDGNGKTDMVIQAMGAHTDFNNFII